MYVRERLNFFCLHENDILIIMCVILDVVLLTDFARVRTLRKYKKLSGKKFTFNHDTIFGIDFFMIKDKP